ncbi:GTPase Era [Isoalcanivorax indicus]|uniref:GTPase Era n=1 Tax=Isoalcanivorax indicus TaxID=2202653 RepID=UPI000DB90386|nr:GTPase Era [Isoalcanivorax indicus]
MTESASTTRCGVVSIIGRPNVGKSTLMNHLIGQKISITSRKPQTTRHRIHGILTREDYQIIFADTPGIHQDAQRALNKAMNQSALTALAGIDLICFMVDALKWTDADEHVLALLQRAEVPVLLIINKVDSLEDKAALLPHIQRLSALYDFADVIPVSALGGHNLDALEAALAQRLPAGDFWYDEDQITDRSLRFMAAEMIREKVFRQLGQELPHQITVEVELWEDTPTVTRINAAILVERRGQKKILIGSGGDRIKKIGTEARQDIEALIERKVMLELWVKIRSGWSDDSRALRSLGYGD